MSDLQLILYDDDTAQNWFPFSLTRPAGELLFGAHTMRERAELLFGGRCIGHITHPGLSSFDEPDAAPVIALESIPTTAPRVFLSARAILRQAPDLTLPAALVLEEETVGWVCPAGAPNPSTAQLQAGPAPGGPTSAVPGILLGAVWELMSRNTEQLKLDLADIDVSVPLPGYVALLGEPRLRMGRNVTIEPQVVFDFNEGPIWLDDDVTVKAFTRLAGPSYIGKGTTLLGGPYSAVSIGPHCKFHGEVEATVVLGYANKAHDGFLGHAYLGQWVNLGALTTNSDLKNNYGSIRLWTPQGEVDTGEMKIGCLLGDHVKAAIGTMINTGTVIGPGSNIFGGAPAKFVAPFSWGAGEYEFGKFIETAAVVMSRRKQKLSEKQGDLLKSAWERGRALTKT